MEALIWNSRECYVVTTVDANVAFVKALTCNTPHNGESARTSLGAVTWEGSDVRARRVAGARRASGPVMEPAVDATGHGQDVVEHPRRLALAEVVDVDLPGGAGRGPGPHILDRDDDDEVRPLIVRIHDQHPGPRAQDEPEAIPSPPERWPEQRKRRERLDRSPDTITRRFREAVRPDEMSEILSGRLRDDDPCHQ